MGRIKDFERGTVVKLDTPPEWHNVWAVIICKDEVTQKYIGVPEAEIGKADCDTIIEFEDEDVKWPIGTVTEDLVGIGTERHLKEVASLIKDALTRCKCKV